VGRPEPWAEMAPVWLDGAPVGLWRRHADAMNVALAERWLPGPLGELLKTDLFDEAVAEGLLPSLRERAARVVGVDVEPEILGAAATRLPGVEVVAADVRRLPFDDAAFDTVLSNSTLDHFPHPREIHVALRELARVLRPGGRLLVTLDNPANPVIAVSKVLPRASVNRLWSRLGGRTAKIGLAPYVVGATLSPARLRRALLAAGLRPVASDTLVHAPRAVAVVVGSRLERAASRSAQDRFVDLLGAFERLRGTPVGHVTAHFHAVLAVKL
jgi:SAM-dependent methyltransferase